jgi:hypothetical protein
MSMRKVQHLSSDLLYDPRDWDDRGRSTGLSDAVEGEGKQQWNICLVCTNRILMNIIDSTLTAHRWPHTKT